MPSRVSVAVNNLLSLSHTTYSRTKICRVYKWLDPARKSQKQNSNLARLILAPMQHSNSSHFCTGPQDSWPEFNSPTSPHSEWSFHPTVIMQISQMEPQKLYTEHVTSFSFSSSFLLLPLCLSGLTQKRFQHNTTGEKSGQGKGLSDS